MHYIVFPGNVGDKDALARVAIKLGVKQQANSKSNDDNTRQETKEKSSPQESKMLITLREAQQRGYAIAAFNVYNLEGAKAVVEQAEALGCPAILQVHPSSLKFGGKALIDMLISFRSYSKVPIFVHLDHSTNEKDVELALRCGVDSIMVDGSAMPLQQNILFIIVIVVVAISIVVIIVIIVIVIIMNNIIIVIIIITIIISSINDLLDKESYTLEELLQEDELLQEIKSKNDRLVAL